MDIISFNEASTANGRIEKVIANPDSTSGIVTVPSTIPVGETITIPAGRMAVLPNVQVDGTLNIEGDVFIPSGATFSKVVETEGNQTIDGVKTFSSSPVVPNATTATQPIAYGQAVKNTGDETIAGVKTFSNTIIGNISGTSTKLNNSATDWSASGAIGSVVGMLAWKNYGNNHVIFDASNGTSPAGTAVNNTNAQIVWSSSHPTLMGWNGIYTYGVRVDSARVADAFSTTSGSAPSYACRAWVNFNGTGTVAIRASGNVSSITDNGVGDYTVNFTNAMPDANYAGNVFSNFAGGAAAIPVAHQQNNFSRTTAGFRFQISDANSYSTTRDNSEIYVSFFR